MPTPDHTRIDGHLEKLAVHERQWRDMFVACTDDTLFIRRAGGEAVIDYVSKCYVYARICASPCIYEQRCVHANRSTLTRIYRFR